MKNKPKIYVVIGILALILLISCSNSSKLTEKNILGTWEEHEGSEKMEFFQDGTGMFSDGDRSMSFKWTIRDENRLQIDLEWLGAIMLQTELSEKGKVLTLIDPDDDKTIYRKK